MLADEPRHAKVIDLWQEGQASGLSSVCRDVAVAARLVSISMDDDGNVFRSSLGASGSGESNARNFFATNLSATPPYKTTFEVSKHRQKHS
jgi:hypothetical protein